MRKFVVLNDFTKLCIKNGIYFPSKSFQSNFSIPNIVNNSIEISFFLQLCTIEKVMFNFVPTGIPNLDFNGKDLFHLDGHMAIF